MKVVEDHPGLTGGKIAAKLGKHKEAVVNLLWNLKKYCDAVRVEKSGFGRTPGLDDTRRPIYRRECSGSDGRRLSSISRL